MKGYLEQKTDILYCFDENNGEDDTASVVRSES